MTSGLMLLRGWRSPQEKYRGSPAPTLHPFLDRDLGSVNLPPTAVVPGPTLTLQSVRRSRSHPVPRRPISRPAIPAGSCIPRVHTRSSFEIDQAVRHGPFTQEHTRSLLSLLLGQDPTPLSLLPKLRYLVEDVSLNWNLYLSPTLPISSTLTCKIEYRLQREGLGSDSVHGRVSTSKLVRSVHCPVLIQTSKAGMRKKQRRSSNKVLEPMFRAVCTRSHLIHIALFLGPKHRS